MLSTAAARRLVSVGLLSGLTGASACGRDSVAGPDLGPAVTGEASVGRSPGHAPTLLPPTLTGEILTSTSMRSEQTGTCPGPVRISYVARGAAAGPYPGTFFERGVFSFTFDPPSVHSTSFVFEAEFVILSARGFVTGTKSFGPRPGGALLCHPDGTVEILGDIALGADEVVPYSATIYTSRGAFRDRGRTSINMVHTGDAQNLPQAMVEEFLSTQPLTPVHGPGDPDDDDDDGGA